MEQFPLITVSERREVVALLVAQKAAERSHRSSFEKPICNPPFQQALSTSLTGETSICSFMGFLDAVSFHSAGVPNSQFEVFELLTEAVVADRWSSLTIFSLRASEPRAPTGQPPSSACINEDAVVI